MKKKLDLHEAIAIVLLNKPNRTATIEEIKNIIHKRELWFRPSDNQLPEEFQIRLRTELPKPVYQKWFEFIKPNIVRLRNCEF